MRRDLVIAILFMPILLASCKSVWVHPAASSGKFRDDDYLCRYGEARPSEAELRSRGLARSEEVPAEVIVPDETQSEVNTGSGTNINVNVRTAASQPVVIPGHTPRRPAYRECMTILGWWVERKFLPSSRVSQP